VKRAVLVMLCLFQLPSVLANDIRVATIQFASVDGGFETNLAEVQRYVRRAKSEGAVLALLPELALIGYKLSEEIWTSAEHAGGPTQQALSTLAKENDMYIGTSFLEVKGERFFNTFILVNPRGNLVGSVRKQVPAGAEGYFFEGYTNKHIIDTPLGKIGIGICQETYRCFLPQLLHDGDADFVLMPFSYPDLSQVEGLESPKGTYIAQWYADQLGVPIVTSNKTGVWPMIDGAFFPGLSAAVNGNGQILGELESNPGVLVVDLSLDDSAKVKPTATCIGPFLKELTLGSWLEKRITWASIWLAESFNADPDAEIHAVYIASEKRRTAALKHSQEPQLSN